MEGELAVAGFDDIPVARLIRPSLTTVRTNIADLSRRALERLAMTIANPEYPAISVETVQPQLVVRESSASRTTMAKTPSNEKIGETIR